MSIEQVINKLDLISESEFQQITGATNKTLESWRKTKKYFPAIRLGTNYYYPLDQAKKFISDLVNEKCKPVK